MDLETLNAEITAVGNEIRDLKANGMTDANQEPLKSKLERLLALKGELKKFNDQIAAENQAKQAFREGLEELLLRKFFFVNAFEIYRGVAGLYDYGPPGCAIMANLQQYWRQHFVLAEQMLEISCPSLTPEPVLKASGHVDRFTDYMVQDVVTNEYHRADKLVEEKCEQLLATRAGDPKLIDYVNNAGSMTKDELQNVINELGLTSLKNNPLSPVTTFNLMFKTEIGPTGKVIGYLRPETAQGIFVNFRRLYEYNNKRLPFAAAQIGLAYRNEIAPRAGLLRVREFPLAEIEHFVNPSDKNHPRFKDVSHIELNFLPKQLQVSKNETIRRSMREAVYPPEMGQEAKFDNVQDAIKAGFVKLVDNETLGYYLVRTYQFLVNAGIDPARIRFRQHKDTEKAHYSTDCWDAEILTTYGWIECVGHADRSAYDLRAHTEASKVDLSAQVALETPRLVRKLVAKPNLQRVGRTFRKNAPVICDTLAVADQAQLAVYQAELEQNNKTTVRVCGGDAFELTSEDVVIEEVEEKEYVESFLPSVIEPSFGLGRIIYAMLEHAYYVRPDDAQRKVLRLSPLMAPVKLGVYNVVGNIDYQPVFDRIREAAIELNVSINEDTSKVMIGRKYARGDELGIPFAISVDNESVDPEKQLVTIRERDSMKQVQVKIDEAVEIVAKLCRLKITWQDVVAKYGEYVFKGDAE